MSNQKTVGSYLVGLVLSIIFIVVAYHLVMAHHLPKQTLYIAVVVLGVLQLLAQLICFFRLSKINPDDKSWNWVALAFTFVVIVIVVTGSLWIMYNLNYNMMVN
jgi:cytochrome o ubiquinol oxidase operon protein cyoD